MKQIVFRGERKRMSQIRVLICTPRFRKSPRLSTVSTLNLNMFQSIDVAPWNAISQLETTTSA